MLFSKKPPVTWLVVGLGNPGAQYENTRHNAGFFAIDELGEVANVPVNRLKFHALTGHACLEGEGVLLMMPTTYMNLSGTAVQEAANFYKIPPQRVIVLCDDTSLPLGKLRIRTSGSAGGHNGLKDIIAKLGSDQFVRVKMGVGGKPHPDYDMADWVLGKFTPQERQTMDECAKKTAQAVCCLLAHGAQKAMNQFN